MSRLFVLALLAFALVACDGGAPEPTPTPPPPLTLDSTSAEIVARYYGAHETFANLSGVVVGRSQAGEFRQQIWYEEGRWRTERRGESGQFRWVYPEPVNLRLFDGEKLYVADTASQTVCDLGPVPTFITLNPGDLVFPLNLVIEGLRPTGSAVVAARPAIELSAPDSIVKVWLDAVYGVPIKFEVPEESGSIATAEFTEVDVNSGFDEDLIRKESLRDYSEEDCPELIPS